MIARMKAEWATLIVTIATATATAIWSVWKWAAERGKDRRIERNRVDALYVNPFLFAAEDFQSRLYNLLSGGGLAPLRNKYPDGRYADETLYLAARYFALEQVLLRFTPFGADGAVVTKIQAIREVFATDRGGLDEWCFFRTQQLALGQAIIVWREGEYGFPDTVPLVDFMRRLDDGLARDLQVEGALAVLRAAKTVGQLSQRTRARLGAVQAGIVDLLEYLEQEVSAERHSRFTVFEGTTRRRAKVSVGDHAQDDAE
jgi:hypothetical protein